MASSPSAGSSNFCDVILYSSSPSRALITLYVIFCPSALPPAVRSTDALASVWNVVMLRSISTDCAEGRPFQGLGIEWPECELR